VRGFTDGVDEANGKEQEHELEMGLDWTGLDWTGLDWIDGLLVQPVSLLYSGFE